MLYTIAATFILTLLIILYFTCWISIKTKKDWSFTMLIRRINGIQAVRNGNSVAYINLATGATIEKIKVDCIVYDFILDLQTRLVMPIILLVCFTLGILKVTLISLI